MIETTPFVIAKIKCTDDKSDARKNDSNTQVACSRSKRSIPRLNDEDSGSDEENGAEQTVEKHNSLVDCCFH